MSDIQFLLLFGYASFINAYSKIFPEIPNTASLDKTDRNEGPCIFAEKVVAIVSIRSCNCVFFVLTHWRCFHFAFLLFQDDTFTKGNWQKCFKSFISFLQYSASYAKLEEFDKFLESMCV